MVFDGVVPSDFATPCDVFNHVVLENGRSGYEVRVCGLTRTIQTRFCEISTPFTLAALRTAHTVVVPGLSDITSEVPEVLLAAIRSAAQRGARVMSVCSGAFILAATGLLDGRRATTHWLAAAELARRYPAIKVDPNVLYVDERNLLTSAGASAALDLCLHIIRRDYGPIVAARVARLSVVPLERAGGQAQFIEQQANVHDPGTLRPLLLWIEKNLRQELSVGSLAKRAAMSIRTLNRRFAEQTGCTPINWVLKARVRSAQRLLETTPLSIERVCSEAGFGSSAAFRDRFQKIVGISPLAYRRAFRGKNQL